MMRFLKFSAPLVVVFLLLAFLITTRAFRSSSDDRSTRRERHSEHGLLNLEPHVKYVGDRECAVCHPDIYDTFKQTGMGRSFYVPDEDNVIEDYVSNNHVFDPNSNFHYEMVQKNGEFFQIEYRLNEQGERIHELARKVEYVIGSGNHARTYLFAKSGFLYELPITWYSKKQSWDMSPGYRSRNLRFSRPIAERCMTCHNSYADHAEHSANRYANVPHGIGCERCHGPGELHIQKHYQITTQESDVEAADRTIVNPKHLSAELQIDICRQCHLTGTVRILKDGRSGSDFRPGMRLADLASVYVRDISATGDFGVSSHGARMSLSACFTKSGGRLVCTTCHNPHEPVQWRSRESFNRNCHNCHDLEGLSTGNRRAEHTPGGDCVTCHMPQGAASDVLHVNFTDHWIRKEPHAISTRVPDPEEKEDFVLKNFFEEKDPAAGIRLGMAYLKHFEKIKTGQQLIDRAISLLTTGLKTHPQYADGLYYLGKAYFHTGRPEEALQQFQQLARLDPDNASVHFQISKVLYGLGRFEEAAEACRRSLNLFPDDAITLANLGSIHARLGKADEAISSYEKALQIDPGLVLAHMGLGELYASVLLQEREIAATHFRNALKLDPDHFWALHHLGSIHLESGHHPKAIAYFKRSIEVNPTSVSAHGNLAILYSALAQNEEAIRYAHKVLAIDPDNAYAKAMLKKYRNTTSTTVPSSQP